LLVLRSVTFQRQIVWNKCSLCVKQQDKEGSQEIQRKVKVAL
jgi:hypothetical protein